jgi:NADPH:quinone reductase-like Zn-dependent oxidoreductase
MQVESYVFEQFGLDALKRVTQNIDFDLKDTQVLVKIKYIALNYRDLLMVKGEYLPRLHFPMIPCSDAMGEVIAVGPKATLTIGQRVCTRFHQTWQMGDPPSDVHQHTLGGPLQGVFRTHLCIDQAGLIPITDGISDISASTFTCAALTAWSALITNGSLQAGQKMLTIGTGGVSLFAAQIANAMGAKPLIVSRSADKLESLKKTLNFDFEGVLEQNWGKSYKNQIDHIIELGGVGTLEQSLSAVKIGGQVSMIGVLSGAKSEINIMPILMKQIRVQGILVGHAQALSAMIGFFDIHQIEAVIDRVYPWDQALQAFEYLSTGLHMGKIVIATPQA